MEYNVNDTTARSILHKISSFLLCEGNGSKDIQLNYYYNSNQGHKVLVSHAHIQSKDVFAYKNLFIKDLYEATSRYEWLTIQ